MGVVFQLGHGDHKVVEDFLVRGTTGVDGITLNAKAARHQQAAAEVARAGGLDVFLDVATERLANLGYVMPEAPYFPEKPYDVDVLMANGGARGKLIAEVIDAHPETVTAVTPPHFFVNSERAATLNVVLAHDTALIAHLPVRAVLVAGRQFAAKNAVELAKQYAQAGITQLELRLSPFGGKDESLAKLQSGMVILDTFKAAGITTTLGCSGTVGHVAVALGHTPAYSVGIGVLEQVNHTVTINRQMQPPKLDENGKKKPTPRYEGIYLPGIAETVPVKNAAALLEHTDIRLRLGCRLDDCKNSIDGPLENSRRHYLHSRAHEMAEVLNMPAAWRASTEMGRLRRALELRELVNKKYRSAQMPELKTRTLHSILDLVDGHGTAKTA